MHDHASGVTYLNFTGDEGRARARAQYRPGAAERLARIKAAWDPENVFRAVGNIGPAT